MKQFFEIFIGLFTITIIACLPVMYFNIWVTEDPMKLVLVTIAWVIIISSALALFPRKES